MMKKLFGGFLFFFIICLSFPISSVYSKEEFSIQDTEVSYIKKVNGRRCLDLESVYGEVNDASEAITQKRNSIEANKRAGLVSNLTSILSLLGGDGMFCAKDEESLAKINKTNPQGIFGYIFQGNLLLMTSYPDFNVTNHLAQTFVPGYAKNNTIKAEAPAETCDKVGYFCKDACNEIRNINNCKEECKKDCNGVASDGRTFWTLYNEHNGLPDSSRSDAINVRSEKSWWSGIKKFINAIFNSGADNAEDIFVEKFNKVDPGKEEDMKESLGLNEPIYGQNTAKGYGFLQMFQIDKMWNRSRDIVYVLYVAVLIVIGFMIMFRHKIGGQMMVTLGNSIPNIIIGLVLVTFSFAIAGLILDIGKLLINVSALFFFKDEIKQIGSITQMTDDVLKAVNQDANIFAQIAKMFVGGEKFTGSFIQKTTNLGIGLPGQIIKITGLLTLSTIVYAVLNIDLTSAGAGLGFLAELPLDVTLASAVQMPVLIFLIREVIVLLVCVYASFKVFLTMLTTYIRLFITVVLSPFQILMGSFPGNSSMIINWLKSLLSDVLVFVGIFIIINFFTYFAGNIDGRTSQLNFFGNSGALWPSFIVNLKGVVLLIGYIFASNMPGMIKGFLKVGESKELASAGESTRKALGKLPLVGGMFG